MSNETRIVKAGIIGCGKVGHMHARAYQNLDRSELTAVCDANIERAEAFAREFDVKAYRSVEEMAAKSGVEAVSICTPHPLHTEASVRAAKAGLHIAVEKPLAVTLRDCDAIINAVKESGVTATTICQRRFYLPSLRIKRAIEEGKIGRPIIGTVNMLGWRSLEYYSSDPWRGTWAGEGGGVLVNQAPHQLDLLLWYMGEIDSLYGVYDTLNHEGLEVDDTAMAIIRFKSGALGSIVVSNSQNPALFGNVRIHGSNGASVGVQTDGGAMFIAGVSEITEPPVNDLWTVEGEEDMLPTWQAQDAKAFADVDSSIYYHEQQLKDFLDAIITGSCPMITLEEGRGVVELFTAIYRSNRDHSVVKFPLTPETSDDFDGRYKK